MSTETESRFIAFFDECGDHSMAEIDRDFPLFVLSIDFMKAHGVTQLPVTAETRGKNEDNELAAAFLRIMTSGTRSIPADRFHSLSCPLRFRRKSDNIAGMQLADLCAHPAARHILNPSQPNHAFTIVNLHLYQGDSVTGWKVFP